ncbi:aminoglycoside 6-adenylyltransferase [Allokutzneria oryzae]|uniref:Aminoglycoside 6-adenylyltransferase n=1 Tax=Allokutzneria oryzae TaxID=1378989 RepID=A0ABV5ZNB0_9PSEU
MSIGIEGPWENPARLGFVDGGVKIDFQVLPLEHLDELHERGYEVLLDLDGRAARLPAAKGTAPQGELPDAQEFREHCEEFWFELAHIPRYLTRGELWVAKSHGWEAKQLLLTMVEWHAVTRFGAGHDTWYGGSKMRTWAAPGVWERLDALFGGFQADDALRAARATAELARDVAKGNGFTYPEEADRAFRNYLPSDAS